MFKRFGSQILRSVFRVQPGEGERVGGMLLYSLAAVGGVIITGQLVSRALFLSSLPESAIPYKVILSPLVLMVTTAVYTGYAGRWRRDHLIVVSCALMVLGVGAFRLLLETGVRGEFAFLCALFVVPRRCSMAWCAPPSSVFWAWLFWVPATLAAPRCCTGRCRF